MNAIENLANEARLAARFIRDQTPESLRAWAARKEDMQRNGLAGSCLVADRLDAAADTAKDSLTNTDKDH